MNPTPRVYISAPLDRSLDQTQLAIKEAITNKVINAGFDPQEFNVSGLPAAEVWSFENVEQIMRRCHGALILAFAQWDAVRTNNSTAMLPTEYNHYEGAVALTLDKETLIIKDDIVAFRGVTFQGGGRYILSIPPSANPTWLDSKEFKTHFDAWSKNIENRHHVFFGYSGQAIDTANRIIKYLNSLNVKVRDWQIDFRPAGTILGEIEEAARKTLGGIFLFTKDDDLVSGDQAYAAPRDNVVFEAGYFMHAVGKEKSLIIRENGAKMPADVGGAIYLDLKDRNNTASIETSLRKFVENL
jgi:hypothetical protein